MSKMPALFIGHGSPMNTLENNNFTREWQRLGKALPRPRGLLVVSAHWYIGATAVTAMPNPRTIHDFYGFPQALFDFDYPAPGLPELAEEIAEVAKPHWVGADHDQWGLDHGTWSVLAHLFPEAKVPVVQISINSMKDKDYHLDLGAKLAPLRDQGIMIVSSGNVVHNLREIDWKNPDGGEAWAQRFDDAAEAMMHESPSDLLKLGEHADYARAVPTPDHYIPLLYTAGLAGDEGAQTLIKGYSMGSLSMTCYGVGMDEVDCTETDAASTLPADTPPDQTNM